MSKDDTSRGPLAAGILRKRMEGEDITIESRGTVVLFPEPMNPKTVAIAASRNIDLSDYTATQLQNEDFGKDVLALVFDEGDKQVIYDEFKDAVNVYTFKEFINEQGSVIDPYGGELADYGKVFEELDQLTYKLVSKIRYDIS
ncbi:MAG: protein tyrosine phosphatase [Lachnospiraceae bacterium]|nr:protein tyrosine phosphatase [Lachnospiraceae bacterium]